MRDPTERSDAGPPFALRSVVFAIRIHGRGGQGAVTAAELLSLAAFAEGRHAQAFPSFGSERNGAPVVSFCRIDDHAIRLREPIAQPDGLIVLDPTLFLSIDVFAGLSPEGYVLINSKKSIDELGLSALAAKRPKDRIGTIAATEIARHFVGRPLPNVPLLGAFAAQTGLISIDSVVASIRERFAGKIGESNAAAAKAAHDALKFGKPWSPEHAQAN